VKRNVILAGVGGQGLLSVAAVIGEAARHLGMRIKQSEVHGMAQRGGGVLSHVRYGDEPIYSDLIPRGTADLILALEPMEALRYVSYLSPNGAVVSHTLPFVNIPDYPDAERVLTEIRQIDAHTLVDAVALAREVGAPRAANMVMLGAGSPYLELEPDALVWGIRRVFAGKRPETIESNVRAFRLGAFHAGDT
jgi:indolepyruvate ferredoxin oxidoreductase beta subunit